MTQILWTALITYQSKSKANVKIPNFQLTHICLVDPRVPFPILGVSGVLCNFHSISNRYSC